MLHRYWMFIQIPVQRRMHICVFSFPRCVHLVICFWFVGIGVYCNLEILEHSESLGNGGLGGISIWWAMWQLLNSETYLFLFVIGFAPICCARLDSSRYLCLVTKLWFLSLDICVDLHIRCCNSAKMCSWIYIYMYTIYIYICTYMQVPGIYKIKTASVYTHVYERPISLP